MGVDSINANKLPEEFQFELDKSIPAAISKEDIVESLSNSVQLLSPSLMQVDSAISKCEPVLHIVFRGIYLYYAVFGKLDISKFSQECDDLVNIFCKYILDSYFLYQYHRESHCKPEDLLILKNSINLISMFFCCSITHARLVDLRSRATLKILKARSNPMNQLLESQVINSLDALDQIIHFTGYNDTLSKYCMPDNYNWIDISKIMNHIVKSSLNDNEFFAPNYNNLDSNCICDILEKECSHKNVLFHPQFNFCLTYWPSRIFMEFSFISLEEYYTKMYLSFLNKLQFNHDFLPVDIILTVNKVMMPSISLESLSKFTNSDLQQFNEYRGHPVYSSFLPNALQRSSTIIGNGIVSASEDEIAKFRSSLPVSGFNSLSSESSYEESQIWIKLAVQLAYHTKDVIAVIHSTSVLIRNMMYIGKDYLGGIQELDKLIQFEYSSLVLLPRNSKNLTTRKSVQSNIIRDKSILIQYKKHIMAGLITPFYPAQLLQVNINGSNHDVIYFTFEFSSKPVYIANIDSIGGVCWSIINADLSISSSWNTIAFDNCHLHHSVVGVTNLTIRFLFHAIRTGEYTFKQFVSDLKSRDKIIIN